MSEDDSQCSLRLSGVALAFDPLAELVQVVHGAVLAQLDRGLVALQCSCGGEGLLQGEHHLVHLGRDEWEGKKTAERETERGETIDGKISLCTANG